MRAVISKGKNRGKVFDVSLMSDQFSVAVVIVGEDGKRSLPMPVEDVYFNSDDSKEVMASEHFHVISRTHEPVFVESGFGDYVFAFKKKKKQFSYAR